MGFALLVALVLAFALPCRGAESEVYVELYIHPLKGRPARAGGVAGFLLEENAIALRGLLQETQPLVASSTTFALAGNQVVDAPVPCPVRPGMSLPPTKARIIVAREPREISLSGSVIMQLDASPHPFLRSFTVRLPGELNCTYCVRGMFFPASDQVYEALLLLTIQARRGSPAAPRKSVPPLLLEPPANGAGSLTSEPTFFW